MKVVHFCPLDAAGKCSPENLYPTELLRLLFVTRRVHRRCTAAHRPCAQPNNRRDSPVPHSSHISVDQGPQQACAQEDFIVAIVLQLLILRFQFGNPLRAFFRLRRLLLPNKNKTSCFGLPFPE